MLLTVNWVPTCCALTVILEAQVAMAMAIRMAMRVAIPVIRTDMAEEMWDNFLASYKLLIWVPVWLGKNPWFGVTWWALMHRAWRKDNLQPNMGSYNDANVQQNMGLAGALEADMEYFCYMNLYALQSIPELLDALSSFSTHWLYGNCLSERWRWSSGLCWCCLKEPKGLYCIWVYSSHISWFYHSMNYSL